MKRLAEIAVLEVGSARAGLIEADTNDETAISAIANMRPRDSSISSAAFTGVPRFFAVAVSIAWVIEVLAI